jgi:hypothetical protein
MNSLTWPKAKTELREDTEPDFASCFSPETVGLIQGLGDSPESLSLKADYLKGCNFFWEFFPVFFGNFFPFFEV